MNAPIMSWPEYQAEKERVRAEWRAKKELHDRDWNAWLIGLSAAIREVDKRYNRGFTIRQHRSMAA